MKLVVGLGNPGKEYENTRHNIGFMVLNYFPGNNFCKEKFNGLYCEKNINGEKVIFVKPLTYMNLSGNCVIQYVKYFHIQYSDILVIQDDLDLPFLNYRLKFSSSAGGHNGMKSIINCLGTQDIPRLKIGIARNSLIDTKDYVLSKISNSDLQKFNNLLPIYEEIILDFVNYNIEYCMQKYNKKQGNV